MENKIGREVLLAQRERYQQGLRQAQADANAFNGAIEAINGLLAILDEGDKALEKPPTK